MSHKEGYRDQLRRLIIKADFRDSDWILRAPVSGPWGADNARLLYVGEIDSSNRVLKIMTKGLIVFFCLIFLFVGYSCWALVLHEANKDMPNILGAIFLLLLGGYFLAQGMVQVGYIRWMVKNLRKSHK